MDKNTQFKQELVKNDWKTIGFHRFCKKNQPKLIFFIIDMRFFFFFAPCPPFFFCSIRFFSSLFSKNKKQKPQKHRFPTQLFPFFYPKFFQFFFSTLKFRVHQNLSFSNPWEAKFFFFFFFFFFLSVTYAMAALFFLSALFVDISI
jgi:hypothetical protein